MWTAIGLTVSAVGNFMMAMPHFIGTGQVYEVDADEAARMNDKVIELHSYTYYGIIRIQGVPGGLGPWLG